MSTIALSPGTEVRSSQRTYTIRSVLGQGGFGITYLVETELQMGNIPCTANFALKEHFIQMLCERESSSNRVRFMQSASKEVESSKRAFVSEAQRLQRLGIQHRNVVSVDEVFEANGTAYYVMEYLTGGSLANYIKSHGGRLTWADTAMVMQPICDAVAMLHRNRVAHYDIKPQNIMVTTNKQGLRPVLIDFGLAKHYDGQGQATSSIAAGGYTPGYAPVEQYTGIQEFSPTADVYALAATICYCLTGHAPAKADKLNLSNLSDELLTLGVDAAVVNILLRALEYRPADRPADAGALVAALFDPQLEVEVVECDTEDSQPTVKIGKPTEPLHPANIRPIQPAPAGGGWPIQPLPGGSPNQPAPKNTVHMPNGKKTFNDDSDSSSNAKPKSQKKIGKIALQISKYVGLVIGIWYYCLFFFKVGDYLWLFRYYYGYPSYPIIIFFIIGLLSIIGAFVYDEIKVYKHSATSWWTSWWCRILKIATLIAFFSFILIIPIEYFSSEFENHGSVIVECKSQQSVVPIDKWQSDPDLHPWIDCYEYEGSYGRYVQWILAEVKCPYKIEGLIINVGFCSSFVVKLEDEQFDKLFNWDEVQRIVNNSNWRLPTKREIIAMRYDHKLWQDVLGCPDSIWTSDMADKSHAYVFSICSQEEFSTRSINPSEKYKVRLVRDF